MKTVQLLCLVCIALPSAGAAEEVLIAVASNFAAPMEQIAADFERDTAHDVELVFGSSGRLFAQISNGAPFQLFFSADQEKPQRLESSSMTVPGSRFTYAIGTLVLWTGDDRRAIEGPEALQQPFARLALANPALAPYGAAAMEVLENLQLLEITRPKWVRGENIAQSFQFVETANADLGFIALSQVIHEGEIGRGNGWIVPGNYHAPIRQDAVLLETGRDCMACSAFLDYMVSTQVEQTLNAFGYRSTPQ